MAMATSQVSATEGSSIQVDYKSGRSTYMFILQKILRPIRSLLLKHGDLITVQSPEIKIPSGARKDCDVTHRQINGIHIYDLVAKAPHSHHVKANGKETFRQKRVLYFAGGGWQMAASSQHVYLCAGLARLMPNTTISIISYPLAPEYPAPKSFPIICDVYKIMHKEAMEANEALIVAGDSAGGNIALCLTMHLLSVDPDAPAPTAIMALSPSTDLRRQHPVMPAVAKHDPLLTIPFIKDTANKWRGDWDAFDPRVSPLAADVQLLADRNVQVHGIVGTYDVLSLDAILFRTKLNEAGVKGRWLEWDRQMHVWVLTAPYGLKEAKEGVEWVANVLNET